mmetsp:Transcript_46375/g.97025  ORF Transcript_46375/g.97025 Transcript_46375/m.97025 type:complete len:233 (+) Transcript_46375:579-1277(+)
MTRHASERTVAIRAGARERGQCSVDGRLVGALPSPGLLGLRPGDGSEGAINGRAALHRHLSEDAVLAQGAREAGERAAHGVAPKPPHLRQGAIAPPVSGKTGERSVHRVPPHSAQHAVPPCRPARHRRERAVDRLLAKLRHGTKRPVRALDHVEPRERAIHRRLAPGRHVSKRPVRPRLRSEPCQRAVHRLAVLRRARPVARRHLAQDPTRRGLRGHVVENSVRHVVAIGCR